MSNIQRHYEIIGRILSFLVNQGLRRIDFDPSGASEIMESSESDDEFMKTFTDVLRWMHEEGLIRAANISETMDGVAFFIGVQLTAKGIAVIQADPGDPELGTSIEKRVTETRGSLDASVFTKIGSFVGGMLGGFTKAVGS